MPARPKARPIYVQRTSKPLPVGTHVTLFLAACRLAKDGEQRVDIAEDARQGFVETNWDSAAIGDLSGPLFRAELEREEGKIEVSYIVRQADIEEALHSDAPLVDLDALLGAGATDPKMLN